MEVEGSISPMLPGLVAPPQPGGAFRALRGRYPCTWASLLSQDRLTPRVILNQPNLGMQWQGGFPHPLWCQDNPGT